MSDDGLGPYILKQLKKMPQIRGVSYYNAATDSLSCFQLLKDTGKILIVDALHGGYSPGTTYRIRANRLNLDSMHMFSLHEMHLLHLAARFFPERLREITVLAVEPENIEPGLSLSAMVQSAVPLLIRLIIQEISRIKTVI
ncbi:MAG: hydrogenase maturation protease [Clostridiales bacterium]|nr:hydrogenase maturation protease [Clostridiales bacterium]